MDRLAGATDLIDYVGITKITIRQRLCGVGMSGRFQVTVVRALSGLAAMR